MPLIVLAAAASLSALTLAGGVSGATAKGEQCATPVYQNGLELVFGRAKSRVAADRITANAQRSGFKQTETMQETCAVWKSVLRGIDSYDAAVGVQAEARSVRLFPTLECLVAQEI